MANVVEIVLKGTDQFSGMLNRAGRSLGDFKAVALSFAAASAAAMVAAGSAAAAFTKQAINTADETGKMAQKAGLAVETFSALQHAAALSDVSNESLIKGLKGLSLELVKGGRGSADLSAELLAIADDFANAADGAAKTAIAVQHFGKAGQDMIPLLNQGSDAIRAQMEEAKKFGLVISSGFAANAEEFNDNLTRMSSVLKGLWLQVAEKVLPTFNALLEMFLDFTSNTEAMKGTVEVISLAFDGLGEVIMAVAQAWMTAVGMFNGESYAEIGAKLLALEERFESAREKFSNLTKPTGKGGGENLLPFATEAEIDKSIELIEKMRAGQATAGWQMIAALGDQARAREEVLGQGIADMEQFNAAVEISDQIHQQALLDGIRQGAFAKADIERAYNEGRVADFIATHNSLQAVNAGTLQGQQDMMRAFSELWTTSLLNVQGALLSFSAQVATTFSQGFGNAVASVITGAQTASQAIKALGTQMLSMLISFITRLAINTALSLAFGAAITAAGAASAALTASAWATPAALVSLATFGANAIPASAGILSTVALSKGLALAGVAHGGLEDVPREGTYLLSAGERVVQPEQNALLTRFLANQDSGGGGGRMMQVSFTLDGALLARAIGEMSRDGRLSLDGRSIT